MYEIEFSPDALEDLEHFRKFEQQIILDGIHSNLRYEPIVESRNRKRLEPNDIADWELRIGRYRVLYDVHEAILVVSIETVGVKVRNQLFVRGKKTDLS
ncbi:MAG: type II toxin-antitoxin system RelE/ParE family toxin [Chloroflexi bacterium]|nr:type II toxin-antitoxin system RelE/ParE family toxin [Chloroflexota bacterium]